jgi:hypothetical protein
MKNSNDTIGNRARDLLTCSAVPQPTAPPRTPNYHYPLRNIPEERRYRPITTILTICSKTISNVVSCPCTRHEDMWYGGGNSCTLS